jgi:glycine C-acetyltransferase
MKDLFDKIREGKGPLGKYQNVAEGYYMFPQLEGPLGGRMMFRGKEVICWSVNNYLGLGNHPDVRKVDAEASADWGLAYPMGSRMMSGETKYHIQLEKELAAFENKEKAVLVNFGYQGMVSAVDSLLSRRDVAVYDSESHACIIDGLRMHIGRRIAFKHNDIDHLEKCLQQATEMAEKKGGGILVISEGVFGMRGDQGRLKEIVALKKKYKFRLFVDDAHGFGTLGKTGAGTGEEQGVQEEIDVYFSTFAKSMASVGAFLAGDAEIIDYLRYNMRSQIFAKSLALPVVIGNIKRLSMLRDNPEHKKKLWDNVNNLQNGLKQNGFDIGVTNSCVTPVYMKGTTEEAMNLVYDLRENHGVFCSIVVYPVVPKGMIILRLIPTAAHTDRDIADTIQAFKAISAKLKAGGYSKSFQESVV